VTSPTRALSPAAVLALVQPWPVEELIHRRIHIMTDPRPGMAVLWIGSGLGRSVLWWAARLRSRVEGVTPDIELVERAEATARNEGLSALATFQVADPAELPHEAAMFDLTLINLMQLPHAEGDRALKEAGRVAKPLTSVVTLAPAWLGAPSEADARAVQALGLRPRRVIEWKEALRSGGMVELEVEEAAPQGEWVGQSQMAIVARGWREWGWAGVRATAGRRVRVLQRLARLRSLGLVIIKGTRWHS
jgi:hypothetical protein